MKDIIVQLISLVINLLIAFIVWQHYRKRTYPTYTKYSTFWPRFWTGGIDSCVLWPVAFATSALSLMALPLALSAFLLIGQSFVWAFYSVIMHAKYGQTVGKMVCKVRVVDFKTEGGLSWPQALLREGVPIVLNLSFVGYEVYSIFTGSSAKAMIAEGRFAPSPTLGIITSMPLLWVILEIVTMLTNKKRRALHDFIAGTIVVRTNVGLQAPASLAVP